MDKEMKEIRRIMDQQVSNTYKDTEITQNESNRNSGAENTKA